MIPDLALVMEAVRNAVAVQSRDTDVQLDTLQKQAAFLRALLQDEARIETLARQMLDRQMLDAMRAAQPAVIHDMLVQAFTSNGGSMRGTEAHEHLLMSGVAVTASRVQEILRGSPKFRESRQGWWKLIEPIGTHNRVYGPMLSNKMQACVRQEVPA